ncbi:poly [ADP-ribose] polymerase 2-A-like [Pistacia vera]|uniref:poly [ADP-ribose] polymerase 2-A-like n=1 Tax=Pistacia vera TaxID=55513 RepID=UPI0012631ED8|nr:poly [ADP-ribose] polymerase 2-A-like [Pistacia vera]
MNDILDLYNILRIGLLNSKKFFHLKGKENLIRMLLWHGSWLTNFVGILSQGLRIAHPEAPATGYMVGKGIYFADLVSKMLSIATLIRKILWA